MPATTTSTPRMVGYQRFGSVSSLPRVIAAERGNTGPLGSETALVVDDRLDLVLRQLIDEVRHAARRDAALAVELVGRHALGDPVELLLAARLVGELDQRRAVGEVGPEGTTARRRRRWQLDVVRVVVRRALRVAARAVQ